MQLENTNQLRLAELPLCVWQKPVVSQWSPVTGLVNQRVTESSAGKCEGIYVSLQALISLAVGPSSRITLLSRQPQGAKLFKYSNSSLLPATPTDTPPLSPASTLPVIICLFIVANLEAIPPINDANCSKWCRSWEQEGELSARGKCCVHGRDNALGFTSGCADINGWYIDFHASRSPVLPRTRIVKQALFY